MTYSMSEGDKVHGKAAPSQYCEKPRELTAREERLLIQAKYNSREVPYQTDNMSCWERKEEAPLRSRLRKQILPLVVRVVVLKKAIASTFIKA